MIWIAVVRHGQTAWNQQRRLQGRSNLVLDATGRRQALDAGARVGLLGVTAVRSSPLARARETGTVIAKHLGLPDPAVEMALIERDYGEAEGVTLSEAGQRWPDGDYPGAESVRALGDRAAQELERLVARHPHSAVVSHGAFLRAGISQLCQRPVPRILNGDVLLLGRGSRGFWEWERA